MSMLILIVLIPSPRVGALTVALAVLLHGSQELIEYMIPDLCPIKRAVHPSNHKGRHLC